MRGAGLGQEAIAVKGRWRANYWLLWRRLSQATVLGLFLLGPWLGLWVLKGNLSASTVLDTLPLTDPYLLLQVLFSGHWPEAAAFTGAALVLGFYLLLGGRTYCSWVCPLNPVTDAAAWLRKRWDIKPLAHFSRHSRYWLLGLSLLLAAVSGGLVWELVNPVSIVYRGLVFGLGLGWGVALAVFLFDLFIARHGWCGHLCPVGAFYSLPGRVSPLRVGTPRREQCNDCMDCFRVCPEPQVITPALKDKQQRPLIVSGQCTRCGRCVDVCSKDVFEFSLRRLDIKTPDIS